ncbi:MAG TPA: MFS transporter [Kofleriaceae bacterium]|nr:MFS transporter [Kofleriaceae bacterium]
MFASLPRRAPWADLDPRIVRVAIARAINTFGLSMVMSFLGIYIVEGRGYPAALYGALALVANLGQSAAGAWAGELSDRIGRRPLITGALSVRAGIVLALGTLVLVDAPLAMLAIVFVASSSLRGCFEPVAYALVADLVKPEDRVAAYGLQRMGTNLGWAAGPAVGALLATVMPYGAVFYVSALGLVAANWVLADVPDPRDPRELARRAEAPPPRLPLRESLRRAADHPPMAALLVGTVVFALVYTQIFTGLGIYVTRELGLSTRALGLLYTVNGALVLALQWPALALIRRHGIARVLVGASLGFAAGFALVGVAHGLGGMVVAISVITVAEVLFAPAHQAATAAASDARRLGTGFGLVSFAQMIGVAFAPLVGGLLLDHAGAVGHHASLSAWSFALAPARGGFFEIAGGAGPSPAVWSVIAALGICMAGIFAVQGRLAARTGPGPLAAPAAAEAG